MWWWLRARRLAGYKFRRQHPCGPYIVDFYCSAEHLAVELDGGQHYTAAARAHDRRRTTLLRRRGVRVLRFPTDLVFRDLSAVLEGILRALGSDALPRP